MQTNNGYAYAILTNLVELNFATNPSQKLTIEIDTPFFFSNWRFTESLTISNEIHNSPTNLDLQVKCSLNQQKLEPKMNQRKLAIALGKNEKKEFFFGNR